MRFSFIKRVRERGVEWSGGRGEEGGREGGSTPENNTHTHTPALLLRFPSFFYLFFALVKFFAINFTGRRACANAPVRDRV